jgi:hypothetical protein
MIVFPREFGVPLFDFSVLEHFTRDHVTPSHRIPETFSSNLPMSSFSTPQPSLLSSAN